MVEVNDSQSMPWGTLKGLGVIAVFVGTMGWMISTRLMEPAAKVLVPRIGSDLKSLEMAIRTYSFEWERFPTPDSTENEGFTPPALTSPIPYVVKLPADPYSDDGTYPYRYEVASSTGEETAIFLSPGPDRVIGFPFEDLVKHGVRGFNRWLYAPTNGVKSAGDIFRVVTEKRDTTNTN